MPEEVISEMMQTISVNGNNSKDNKKMLNWSMYNNTKPLLMKITKRMEYLKCMESFKH